MKVVRIVGGRYHGGKLTCPLAQVQMSKQGSAPPPSSTASLPLFDVTLACEDGNYKIVEIVTVVDVVDEDRVGSSLLQI